jgi:hypothetical protein
VTPSSKTKNQKKKKLDKKFSGKIQLADTRIIANGSGFTNKKMKMYIYNILKKYKGSDLEAIIKNFGKVESYEVKRLYKYQLIKANIFLNLHWINTVKMSYTTVSINGEILNLRYVYASIKKAELDEQWKRTAIIKITGYNGKRDNLKEIMNYLRDRRLYVPFVYGKI